MHQYCYKESKWALIAAVWSGLKIIFELLLYFDYILKPYFSPALIADDIIRVNQTFEEATASVHKVIHS